MSAFKEQVKTWKEYRSLVDDYIDACKDFKNGEVSTLDEGPGSNPPTPPPPPPPITFEQNP